MCEANRKVNQQKKKEINYDSVQYIKYSNNNALQTAIVKVIICL